MPAIFPDLAGRGVCKVKATAEQNVQMAEILFQHSACIKLFYFIIKLKDLKIP